MVKAYWLIGRDIVLEEQKGKTTSDYGSYLIDELSTRLRKEFGQGFGKSTLKDIRQFYLIYQDYTLIGHAPRGQSSRNILSPNLSWTHYRALMRVSRSEARKFYEIESIKNHWSSRELERQIDSLLFDRLAKSKDKRGLMRLLYKGQELTNSEDVIKDPVVLEFLGLPESHQLVESKLEEALINNLQNFLLELGKGFAFVGRQKRLTFDGNHFYADLVFYHTILKCYIIIDIKTRALTHADLGQMLLYVNYFDQECLNEGDNPTIGLILCTKKSDAIVKYTLGDKAKQIFASKYQFHLPTEKELETEIRREVNRIKYQLGKNNKSHIKIEPLF
jgi:predicted nuclease of restriction endonuclease-like (RecB) superfamily